MLSIIKSLLIVTIVLLSTPALKAVDFSIDNLAYTITSHSDHTVQVEGCTPLISGALIIPDSVLYNGEKYAVTNINLAAFSNSTYLTEVYIPKTVVNFVNRCFTYCPALERIVVDSDNPYLDSRDDCNAIIRTSTNTLEVGCKNTIVPNTVKRIGYGAFEGCTSLTSIKIPDSIFQISARAFEGCTGLTSIEIPASVINIDGLSFYKCTNLQNVSLTEGLQIIKDGAFLHCSSLSNIMIPSTVKSIGHDAFSGCPFCNEK